jgi:hypothetical protein
MAGDVRISTAKVHLFAKLAGISPSLKGHGFSRDAKSRIINAGFSP